MTKYDVPNSFKARKGETYGQECDRMEAVLREILKENNSSVNAVKTLAYILMEIPSDFFYMAGQELHKNVQKFFFEQSKQLKSLFRAECEKLKRYRTDRVNVYIEDTV